MSYSPAIRFTRKEAAILRSFVEQLYAEAGFSDVSPEDFIGIERMDIHAVGGVLSSLEKKGVLFVDPDAAPDFHIVYLSDDWFCIHPKWSVETDVPYTPISDYSLEPVECARTIESVQKARRQRVEPFDGYADMTPLDLVKFLRSTAQDQHSNGFEATAQDYAAAAEMIETLYEQTERDRTALNNIRREVLK